MRWVWGLLGGALSIAQAVAAADVAAEASYVPAQQLLTLPVVQVGTAYYAAEFVDQGGYQFSLRAAVPYTDVKPELYARFDQLSGSLTVPALWSGDKRWQARLQQNSTGLFALVAAEPLQDAPEPSTPVLNTTPEQRYSIHADGTVTDNDTHLQWMRCSLGQTWDGQGCQGNLLKLSMQEAAYAAFQTRFAGKSDWRLPSVDEIKSLVYCSSGSPAYWNSSGAPCAGGFKQPTLYSVAFPDAPGGVYWTATNLQADPGEDYNLTVSFNYGHVYYSYFNDAYEYARFVRGQSTIIAGPEYIGGFKE